MNAQMQNAMFTHAKCHKCGHLGKLETFNEEPTVVGISEDGNSEMILLNLKCPICSCTECEALFPNEVN